VWRESKGGVHGRRQLSSSQDKENIKMRKKKVGGLETKAYQTTKEDTNKKVSRATKVSQNINRGKVKNKKGGRETN